MKRRLSAIVPAAALAAIIGAAALGVWSLPAAFGQGAPTPFAIFWNITGVPPYTAVSTANPLPVTPIGGSGTPTNVVSVAGSGSTVGLAPVVSAALEASHVLDAAAGNLYSVTATNLTGGVSGNMQVFNATSAPADGAVTPIVCVPLDSTGKAQAFFSPGPPAWFGTGITVVVSSAVSCFTKTTGVITAMFTGMVK